MHELTRRFHKVEMGMDFGIFGGFSKSEMEKVSGTISGHEAVMLLQFCKLQIQLYNGCSHNITSAVIQR